VNAFARVKALVESKGLFLNPSLRRLGIVALRTIEVLGRFVRCRRRHRYRRRKIVDAIGIKVKIVARRRRCAAASLSQDLPRVSSLGDEFDDHRLQCSLIKSYVCEVGSNT